VHIADTQISKLAAGGPTLAFVIYPQGLAQLTFPWLWSVLFFFMFVLLGIDTQVIFWQISKFFLFFCFLNYKLLISVSNG
jgi:hypothetical protein